MCRNIINIALLNASDIYVAGAIKTSKLKHTNMVTKLMQRKTPRIVLLA
jgi:hypothetical protein